MKIRNDTNITGFDPSGNLAPWQFYGGSAPDTSKCFTDAPLLSEYWDVTNAVKYVKTANNKAAADWAKLIAATSDTYTGDLTITGTLTAGAVTALAS